MNAFPSMKWTRKKESYKMKPEKKHQMAQKIKVVLVFGGRSAEHEVSLISADSIYKNLDKKKYNIISIYINKKGKWRITDSPHPAVSDLNRGSFWSFLPWSRQDSSSPVEADIYFPVLHGPYGEDGTIQGLFEMADVPYVGATVLASAVGMDKTTAKALFLQKKLPIVKHLALHESQWKSQASKIQEKILEEFPLPFFVKPSNLGSSIGITKVSEHKKAAAAIQTAFQYNDKILIEEGVIGREIECSVLGNADPRVSVPGEIIPYREFYDYKDKYINGKTSFVIPADLPPDIIQGIQDIAIQAFQAVECSGMARVDFFLQEKTNAILLNEINTIPGFTEISMYPKLWEVSGLPYSQLLDELIRLGLERHQRKKRKGTLFQP
jgi:D-alanine-D-alanine ligase